MSHKNKKTLHQQVIERIESMFCPGRSKIYDKQNSSTVDHIYSYSTRKTYLMQAMRFVGWVKLQPLQPGADHRPRTLDDCRSYVEPYIHSLIISGISAWTIKTAACALGKIYQCSISEFDVDLPMRHRRNITRSRGKKTRDAHFSEENNRDFVDFCLATGLRRHELMLLRGCDLIEAHNNMCKIFVRSGKGGRPRESMIYSADPSIVKKVVSIMKAAGNGLVWPHLPSGADIHSYRSQYAAAVYRHFARPVEEIPRYDRYYCRGDLAGVCYDRRAMQIASEQLGHSRIGVIASNYLREDK